MERPRYRAWTKATRDGAGEPRYGIHWITSRRGWFRIFADRVECGDWVIPNSAIQEAVLFKTKQGFIPVSVLRLTTAGTTYQFGFNPWVHLERYLPFNFRSESVKLKYSAFSLAVRIAVLGYLLLWIWRRIFGEAIYLGLQPTAADAILGRTRLKPDG
jgi:hypothetical protein